MATPCTFISLLASAARLETAAGVKQFVIASLRTAQVRCPASTRRASCYTACSSETLPRGAGEVYLAYLALDVASSRPLSSTQQVVHAARCTEKRHVEGA